MRHDHLIDKIYEAAALPELWPDLFDEISITNGFVGAGMFTMNAQYQRGSSSAAVAPLLADFLKDGWTERNPRAPRVAARNHPGFLRDHDILTQEEIDSDPMYVELLRPHGVGLGAGSVVNCPNGDVVALSFESDHRLGPVSDEVIATLDGLRPHLARAAVFCGRLDLERSRAQVTALSAVGLPAAVLTPTGSALAANDLFLTLGAQVTIEARDVVRFRDPAAARLLAQTLAQPTGANALGRSVPVKARDDAPPTVFHILPIRRAARDVFTKATWLIVATALGGVQVPTAAILGGLFDLSPAEARVARGLVEGRTVGEIAADHGLSEATVRNQLRAVFVKTGVSRQSELVLLCGGITMPAMRDGTTDR